MTTLTTYQNLIEKVGLSKLDEANKDTYNIVKEGSANFTDPNLWSEMLADSDIRDAYDMHVKALEKMASSTSPKSEMVKAKVKAAPKEKVHRISVKKEAR